MVVIMMMLVFLMLVIMMMFMLLMLVIMMMFMLLMVMIVIVVMMLFLMLSCNLNCLFDQLIERICMFHRIQDYLTVDVIPRCCDNGCILVMLTQHSNCIVYLLLRYILCTGKYNRSSTFYLVVEELTEVLHIHLALCHINNGCCTVDYNIRILLCIFNCLHNI